MRQTITMATGTTMPTVMTAAAATTIPMATATGTITSMTEAEGRWDGAALVRLMTWLSPAFPVGAFTYSHGLEWAIEEGTVTSAEALRAWIAEVLAFGAGRSDAILLSAAYDASRAGEMDRLFEVAELAHALQPSRERRLEAGAQGMAFARAVGDTWGAPTLLSLAERLKPVPVTYAVAVGAAAADHGLPKAATVEAFLTAFVANLTSAAVRAVPLGQTDGQRVIRDLAPTVAAVASQALLACLDDVGGCALRADVASMLHETQYTRLFRS
ncbi:urease accessory protein UreF [Oryzibacter oryziterrae]|uniref:urease accessory protein UreF n=1 Tax=Oryzibacter oryziterrae TaxID=2766474 RepID=UPI001F2F5DFE|nr:urease accessory protein UreF [Oryzibacter oryziterrae]